MSYAIGTRILDDPKLSKLMNHQLSDFNLTVGDVVMYKHNSQGNSLVLYRVTKDSPPMKDLVWNKSGILRWSGSYQKYGWVKPGTTVTPPKIRIYGCVEISPVIELLPSGARKHTVGYCHISSRIMKVDVLAMAKVHANFQDFIKREVARLST